MKIQKQLLESLIRVCAKEVLAQLNEGKKKSKKRKVVKEIELPDEEESDEPNEEEDKNDICPTCNGSGEGMADGLSCSDCKGSGSTHSKNKHDDDEPDGGFVNRDRGEDEARNWGGIDEEDSETVGASSTGSGESVDIETERPEIDSEPSEKETPKKKEKLQGIVLLTPSGELRPVPFRQWADESSIERTLHKVGASIGGNKVKIAISTMKKVRVGMSDKTPTYIFLGKYDPNGEELFVMADRDLNSAKEQAVKPEDISGEASGNAIEKYNTDQEINNDDELLAKRMAGADKSSIGAEIGYDDSESGQD